MSLLAPIFLVAFLLAMQGYLLRASCTIAGVDPAPRYFPALGAALIATLIAAIAGAAWSCTFGLLLGFFLSKWAAYAGYAIIVTLIMATVYRSSFALRGGSAIAVAVIHQVMAAAMSGAAWWLYSLIA